MCVRSPDDVDPGGWRLQPFVDEPPGGLVLRLVTRPEVEREHDAAAHDDSIDRPQPVRVLVAAAEEMDVVEQQVYDPCLGHECQGWREAGLPPVPAEIGVPLEVHEDA